MADVTVNLTGVSATATAGSFIVKSYGPLPENHPFYSWVGRIASEWSHLEHVLDGIIWHLAAINQVRGACITAQIMGVGPRCKVIINLGRLYWGTERIFDDATAKLFRTLMSDSYVVADDRARVVHDPWYLEGNQGAPAQFKAMPYSDPRYGFVEITEAEVNETLDKIRKLRMRASELASAVYERVESLRRSNPSQQP